MRRKHPDKEDLQYYSLSQGGYSYREIAEIFDVSVRTAWQGVRRAKASEEADAKARQALADAVASALVKKAGEQPKPKLRQPALVMDFGSSCKPLKLLTCADVHPHGPIPKGSNICCGAQDCHQSGQDHLPALQRNPLTDPAPEPKPKRAQPMLKESGKQKKAAKKQAKRSQVAA